MKLQKLINETFEDEMALININTNEVLIKGDSYHDKIDEMIDGFLLGLSYANVEYKLKENEKIKPSNKLFDICEFSNENYDIDDEEEFDLLEDLDVDGAEVEVDKFIENLEIEIIPHKIKHRFKINTIDGEVAFKGNIIDALEKTKDYEGDLFIEEGDRYSIVYSCQGLELEDNNSCLKEFGIYEDEDNKLNILREYM